MMIEVGNEVWWGDDLWDVIHIHGYQAWISWEGEGLLVDLEDLKKND